MAANLEKYSVVLRSGLEPPEYALVRKYATRLVDDNNPANELLLLNCRSFETVHGYFARLEASDPLEPDIYSDLWVPLGFILLVLGSGDDPKYPIGFAPAN